MEQIINTTQHVANTHVQQVVNTVEVKTLKIIEKSMQGEKVDPDDDQSSKDQSGDQTGRDSSNSVLSRSRSSEFRNHAASLEHARTSRSLCISRQDQAANRGTSL